MSSAATPARRAAAAPLPRLPSSGHPGAPRDARQRALPSCDPSSATTIVGDRQRLREHAVDRLAQVALAVAARDDDADHASPRRRDDGLVDRGEDSGVVAATGVDRAARAAGACGRRPRGVSASARRARRGAEEVDVPGRVVTQRHGTREHVAADQHALGQARGVRRAEAVVAQAAEVLGPRR